MIEAYPLCWPSSHPRAKERKKSTFKTPPIKALEHVINEVRQLAGDKCNPIISSNVPVRKSDGLMYRDIASDKLDDPGVALYFMYEGEQVVICCDKWETPAENVRGIGLSIESMRGLERWGCSDILTRAFTGFKALPQGAEVIKHSPTCWEVLQMEPTKDEGLITAQYKKLALDMHPDRGGSAVAFATLVEARQQATKIARGL